VTFTLTPYTGANVNLDGHGGVIGEAAAVEDLGVASRARGPADEY
jgi:hypothetical protein